MSSLVAEAVGVQQPRVASFPEHVSSAGREAVELAALAGLVLDPWQELVLEHALGERADGRWSAFEVGLVVPRQNGKGAILEARELAGLFLDIGDELIIHSAHQFDTSLEAFMRMEALLESCSDLSRRILRVSRSHGSEGFTTRDGKRLRYRARTGGGGRGFTGHCIVFDEAMDLPEMTIGALMPTLSAVQNPQVWYTGSAVDQRVQPNGVVFSRIRSRGHRGGDASLAFFEWGLEADDPSDLTLAQLEDETLWRQSNPAFGIRITAEYLENERRSMDPRTWAVERLSVGDWPNPLGLVQTKIGIEEWRRCLDGSSRPMGAVAFGFDVTPDRAYSTIAAAGVRSDGRVHVEIVDRRRGVQWLEDRVPELAANHENLGFACDARGPAASVVEKLEQEGVDVTAASAADNANACGGFFDDVTDGRFRYREHPDLDAAVRGAAHRPLGDAWAWSRKSSAADISPLVAATLARWQLLRRVGEPAPAKLELALGAM